MCAAIGALAGPLHGGDQGARHRIETADADVHVLVTQIGTGGGGGIVIGLAVVIASRISALAGADEVLVSSTVADLVIGSGLAFEPAGRHELKGAPGRWQLLRAIGDRPGPLHGDGRGRVCKSYAEWADAWAEIRR